MSVKKNPPGFTIPQADALQKEMRQALTLLQQGQLAQAQQIYQNILKAQPANAEALHLLGVIALQTKRYQAASELIQRAITSNATNATFFANLGRVQLELRQHEEALGSFDAAIALKSDYAKAYSGRGDAQRQLGQLQAALISYQQAAKLEPHNADAHNNLGTVFQELQQLEEALACFRQAIALESGFFAALNNCANALLQLNRFEEALLYYTKAIEINPDYAQTYFYRGNAFHLLGMFDSALASYAKAIAIKPDYAAAYANQGLVQHALQQYESALVSYDRALVIKPDYAEVYNNRGNTQRELIQGPAAVASYERAIAIKPDYAVACSNRGIALQELGQLNAALASYDQAIALDPGYADAYNNRGNTLQELLQFDAAVLSYERALTLNPGYAFLPGTLVHSKMQLCDWRNLEALHKQLISDIAAGIKVSPPFPLLAISDSPALNRAATRIWVENKYPVRVAPGKIAGSKVKTRIRVGYFSSDFRIHPVAHLMAEVFETHDSSQFELYAFCFGPAIHDAMTDRLSAAFEHFIDVRSMSDAEVARLARELEIDIAVDLGGFTAHGRTGIFAYRAAPLQVSYIGYLGTMAAEYFDYLIADRVLIPESSRQFYQEKIVYLPSYQANDRKRVMAAQKFSREHWGLPKEGFVFCCFNNNYKITPTTFAGWMRILAAVEGSVLLLSVDNEIARSNLRHAAQQLGIDKERLILGRHLPLADYMARLDSADLFLDTLPYNAGTTASDALWAGLPVLTCTGQTIASRYAASLLTAIDLPELITHSQQDFEALAIALASNPEQLLKIKAKLQANRLTTLLFDTQGFTRSIETAYSLMLERYQQGLPTEHIDVVLSESR